MEQEKKQSIATLKSMMGVSGSISSSNWDVVLALKQGIADSTIKVEHKQWEDQFKRKYNDPLDLDKIEPWRSTSEERRLSFRLEDGVLMCDVLILEPGWSGGHKSRKFTALLVLPDDFLVHICSNINGAFSKELDRQHEDHLDAQRQQWKQQRADEIVGKDGYQVKTWE